MAFDQGAFGLIATVLAKKTFPSTFQIDQWADDEMPISFDATQVSDHKMLADGNMFSFDVARPIPVKIAVIAGSSDDENLSVLLKAGVSQNSIIPIKDTVILTVNYPGKFTIIFSDGYLRSGPMAPSISQDGRVKGNVYEFVFNAVASTSSKGLIAAAASLVGGLF
jgi:hypothetical protein